MKTFLILAFVLCAPAVRAEIVSPNTNLTAREEQIIAASKAVSGAPQFYGPLVIGIHPNTPLLLALPAAGERPLTFSANKLPDGLKLDSQSGIITGSLTRPGEHRVTVYAKNAAGKASADSRDGSAYDSEP